MIKPGLSLKVSQQLQLTPQLQQSIRLLQLSSAELEQEVQSLLQDNPFLELPEGEGEGDGLSADAPDAPEPMESPEPPERGREAANSAAEAAPGLDAQGLGWEAWEGGDDFDPTDAYTPEAWESSPSGAAADGSLSPHEQALAMEAEPATLSAHLQQQAAGLRLRPLERLTLYFLMENLSEDGYLEEDLPELAPACTAFLAEHLPLLPPSARADALNSPNSPDSPEEGPLEPEAVLHLLRLALGWLQSLEPVGVGARHLVECLHLQLQAQPPPAAATAQAGADVAPEQLRRVALALCQQPLAWLARKDMRRLSQATAAPETLVRAALHWLAQLEPKPGRAFAPVQQYAMRPDVIVRPQGRGFAVQLNPEVIPRLRVHEGYASAVRHSRSRAPEGDYAALHTQVQEARWWVKNLQQRFDTILRVSQAIVQRQSGFFQHGQVAMRPLVLREIAQALDLHESTISRVTNGKYMATPQGTFELKYFFGSGLDTDTGGSASSTAVRAVIQQLIAAEDPKKPLSDAKISGHLQQQGIECARRTVTKYREALQIPVASLRKSL